MNPMHQLTRRPVKAAFGALLLALAGVILALSGGQFWAAARTRAGVEATYTTVAVVTGGAEQAGNSDPSLASASAAWEAARFLEQPEQQNWSIIRSRPRVGLVSGYASNLMPLLDLYNFRSYNGGETMDSAPDAPYTYFILEVLVTDALERHDRPQVGILLRVHMVHIRAGAGGVRLAAEAAGPHRVAGGYPLHPVLRRWGRPRAAGGGKTISAAGLHL